MPTASINKIKGLHTFNNYYSEIPEGALQTADNVNIDRLSTAQSRRGLAQYGSIGSTNNDISKQLLLYKTRVLVHYGDSIAFDNGSGLFTDFTASFTETESGLRIKSVEQNGNLYLTTDAGIRKICATSAATLSSAKISAAGGIKAVGGVAAVDYASEGFFEGYSKVAYRIVWGIKDANSNLILGSPSMPIEVINQSPNSATVNITFDVPPDITTDYFYRIYRTDLFTAATFADIAFLVVNDEYRLVYEEGYSSGTSITINDIVPEDFRQGNVPLYTNESSGEGILQANEPPPFAKDMALYKNSLFYANTRTKYKLLLDMIGTGDFTSFGALGDDIDITGVSYSSPNTTITFSAAHGLTAGRKVVITHSGAVLLDGIKTIASVTPTTIVVAANGTGASATNMSVYGSSITVTKDVSTDSYYFVGRPEVHDLAFPAYSVAIHYTYFIIYSADDAAKYVVYFVKVGDPDTQPNNVETQGAIFIKADVDTGYTATQVAEAVKTALENNSYDFSCVNTLGTLRVSTANSGASTNPIIATIVPVPGLAATNVQDGEGESTSLGYVRLSSLASPSQRIDDTARSLTRVVTSNPSGDVNAYYISGPDDVPGKMLFESRELDTTVFTVVASDADTGSDFSSNITSPAAAENEQKPNRIYYSKANQPEAVPMVNYIDIGPQDKAIVRILGLRDSLFVIKENEIYRLTGQGTTSFDVTKFDNSTSVVAPDSCVILDNQIFAYTTQGIIRMSETGVDIISQPIQDALNLRTAPRFEFTHTASFACSYNDDYAFIIWVPKNETDETGTVAFRFSTKTDTWTSWTKKGNATCAIVNPDTNRLYVGPDDDNIIERERKDLKRTDYADRQYTLSVGANAVDGLTLKLSSISNIEIGDVLVQSQYVTAALVTRLSKKFALDPGVPNTVGNANKDFYRLIEILPGDSLQNALMVVITQLDADLGTSFYSPYSSDINTFKTQFNALITALNTSALLMHDNYTPATNLIEYELTVLSVDKKESSVTVELMMPITVGNIEHFEAIDCSIIFSPYFFGDPAVLKHVRSATTMFANAGLIQGIIGYNTDLSANFEDIDFQMEGTGNWGAWIYDSIAWGGEGTARPFRTLIPRQKQRCRYIRARFKHKVAFDDFSLLGISYTFEANSDRAYK